MNSIEYIFSIVKSWVFLQKERISFFLKYHISPNKAGKKIVHIPKERLIRPNSGRIVTVELYDATPEGYEAYKEITMSQYAELGIQVSMDGNIITYTCPDYQTAESLRETIMKD